MSIDKIHIAYIAISVLAIKLICIMTCQYLYIHNYILYMYTCVCTFPGIYVSTPLFQQVLAS